ncbi:hypothetical protein Tco_0496749, partial [Tanacetum coccineum]
ISLHGDASVDGSVPASKQREIAAAKPTTNNTTNTLSNIKIRLQKDDYDTRWAMEMEQLS